MEIVSNQVNSYRPQIPTNNDESVRKVEDIELTESRTDPGRREDAVNASDNSEPLVASKDKPDSQEANVNPDLETEGKDAEKEASNKLSQEQLNDEERKQLEQLKRRDTEVRAHEAAHLAAAGQYAKGGAKLDLERGPDGGLYAVSGEVAIDTSKPSDPEEAQRKAEQVRAAALAPAKPSTQDRAVAAQASQAIAEARVEIAQERNEEETGSVQPKVSGSSDTDAKEAASKSETDTTEQQHARGENDERAKAVADQYQQVSSFPSESTGVELDVVA